MKKTFYVTPSVEVINVAIEKGFATSAGEEPETTGTIEDVPMHGGR